MKPPDPSCSRRSDPSPIVSQRVVYEKRFLDGWVVLGQAITADSLTA
jgi:hypothetical protein